MFGRQGAYGRIKQAKAQDVLCALVQDVPGLIGKMKMVVRWDIF
jgi:hypothetical protein